MSANYDLREPAECFETYLREEEQRLAKIYPRCELCNELVCQNHAVFYDNVWICNECEGEFWDILRKDYLRQVSV